MRHPKTKALYPGSFDPPTLGHINILRRAAALFDHVTIAVAVNSAKQGHFSPAQRVTLFEKILADENLPNVDVQTISGLTALYAKNNGYTAIIKGLRNSADAQAEITQATINKEISGIDTVFLACDNQFAFISSTIVKELASYGANIDAYVPQPVSHALKNTNTNRPHANAKGTK